MKKTFLIIVVLMLAQLGLVGNAQQKKQRSRFYLYTMGSIMTIHPPEYYYSDDPRGDLITKFVPTVGVGYKLFKLGRGIFALELDYSRGNFNNRDIKGRTVDLINCNFLAEFRFGSRSRFFLFLGTGVGSYHISGYSFKTLFEPGYHHIGSETVFPLSLSTGLKMILNRNLRLKMELRGYWEVYGGYDGFYIDDIFVFYDDDADAALRQSAFSLGLEYHF